MYVAYLFLCLIIISLLRHILVCFVVAFCLAVELVRLQYAQYILCLLFKVMGLVHTFKLFQRIVVALLFVWPHVLVRLNIDHIDFFKLHQI